MPIIGWLVTLIWNAVLWLSRSNFVVGIGLASAVTTASVFVVNNYLSVDAIDTLESNWFSLPPEVMYVLYWSAFDVGVGLVLGAWIIRFSIRRVPLVG